MIAFMRTSAWVSGEASLRFGCAWVFPDDARGILRPSFFRSLAQTLWDRGVPDFLVYPYADMDRFVKVAVLYFVLQAWSSHAIAYALFYHSPTCFSLENTCLQLEIFQQEQNG